MKKGFERQKRQSFVLCSSSLFFFSLPQKNCSELFPFHVFFFLEISYKADRGCRTTKKEKRDEKEKLKKAGICCF